MVCGDHVGSVSSMAVVSSAVVGAMVVCACDVGANVVSSAVDGTMVVCAFDVGAVVVCSADVDTIVASDNVPFVVNLAFKGRFPELHDVVLQQKPSQVRT